MPSAAPPGIGTKLRRARLEQSLSIEETAWRTRIRPDLLRALEHEDFAEIGHPTFVRTHLHSYARFLGIDAAEIVEQLDKQSDPTPPPLEEFHRRMKRSRRPPRARWLVAAAISAAALIAAAAVGLLGGQSERPGHDPVANVLASPITGGSGSAEAVVPARVVLVVDVVRATQLSIFEDGTATFSGAVQPGDVKTFRGRSTIEILVGDPEAVKLTLNGAPVPQIAPAGQVGRAKFGPHGRIG